MKFDSYGKRVARALVVAGISTAIAASALGEGYLGRTNGNPLVPGYFADPCVRKFGDTYYLYATPDGWGIGEGPACFWTSKDFVNWTPHRSAWPATREKWAPSVVIANGQYYMYTQVPCQIWVAVAKTPLGPWTNPLKGRPLVDNQVPQGTITLDGELFLDTDGTPYLAYGTWWTPTIVRLNKDLISWSSEPIQYFRKPGTKTPNGLVQGCMEAPYILKRNGIYYYMYSDMYCANSTYQVKYSTGKTPQGPWTYGANNPILSTNADNSVAGPGHHTVLEDGGETYIIYHQHDNPHSVDGSHRQVAADVMRFGPNNSILPVVPTNRGVGLLAPSTVRDTNWVVDPSLSVTAKASSSAGAGFEPENAADVNNGTLWKASSYRYPQWLQLDLGKSKPVKRVQIDFQFPQFNYQYKVEVSRDGRNWSTFLDRSSVSEWRPAIDSIHSAVTARFFRITILGDDHPERPNPKIGIWNVKLYDGVNRPFRAPTVHAGQGMTCTTDAPHLKLQGSVLDTGLPCKALWTKRSGPGAVQFSDPTSPVCEITFSKPGNYVLELTGKNKLFSARSTVNVKVMGTDTPELLSYDFDEAKDSLVMDHSASCQHGLLASDGDVKHNPERASGLFGKALSFDGDRSYVAVPGLGIQKRLTFSAWVKLDRFDDAILLSTLDGAQEVSIDQGGHLDLLVRGNEPAVQVSPEKLSDSDLGRWLHVAVEYDALSKRVRFGLNGRFGVWQAYGKAEVLALNSGLRIGASTRKHLAGKIDSLRLYRTLVGDEVVRSQAVLPRLTRIRDLAGMADGAVVDLKAVSVTYAPRDGGDRRTSKWFYVADSYDDIASIMVRGDGDIAVEDRGMSFHGILRTDRQWGTRYVELKGTPEVESAPVIKPMEVANVAECTLARNFGRPLTLRGKVISISPERTAMIVADEAGSLIRVRLEAGTIARLIAAGNTVDVTGVAAKGNEDVTLYGKKIRRISPALDPLEEDLVGLYLFDEASGNVAQDGVDEKRSASITGGSWVSGIRGNAVSLDGRRGFVNLPDMGTYPAITIAGWVSPRVLREWQAIFHTNQFEPNRKLHLSIHADGRLLLSTSGNSPIDHWTRPAFDAQSVNTWKHIAVVYDCKARQARVYVDGAVVADMKYASAGPIALAGGMCLGSWAGDSRFFDGRLDEFRFYGRALTESEVKALASSR